MSWFALIAVMFLGVITYHTWDEMEKLKQENTDLNVKFNRLCERMNQFEFRPDGSDSIFEDDCKAMTVDLEEEWM